MKKLGIFFGSDTGNTEKVAEKIKNAFGDGCAEVFDIAESSEEQIRNFNVVLFGISTWYYGEPQCDWDDFLPTLNKIDFEGKSVGLFGCGDQEDYSEYFCDAIGILKEILDKNHAKLIGKWPIDGYSFQESRALSSDDPKKFFGLAIDEDRQPDLTDLRINLWVDQLLKEIE